MKEKAPKDVDPAKWEKCVLDLKGKPGVDAYAVCTSSLRQAAKQTNKKKEEITEEDINEAASSLGFGSVMRPGAKKESAMRIKELHYVGLKEAAADPKTGAKRFAVSIIERGLGNLRDRNYYSAAAIASGVGVYNGKKAFEDHPTEEEEQDFPNREVGDLVGHYEEVQVQTVEQNMCLAGVLCPIQGEGHAKMIETLEHAIEYKKKFPDKHFVGISINGDGVGKKMSYQDFMEAYKAELTAKDLEKLKQVEGQDINVITELTDAVSADVVTEPGAGGTVLALKEHKQFKPTRRQAMFKAMKHFFRALETGDKKALEEATQALSEENSSATTREEDDKQNKEAAGAKAEAMAKAYQAAKKENKKDEKETDEAYEARMLKCAMENMEKAGKEADDKAKADKEAADKAAADKGSGDSGKKDGGKDDDDDDDDDKPAAKDMKALKAKNAEMAEEIESLKKELGKKEASGKKDAEESAAAKTELAIKKRHELIETELAKSGLRREVTSHWKPVLEKCKSDDEVKATVVRMTETAKKVIESCFELDSNFGLIEKQAADSVKSNDDLFLQD